MRPFFHPFHLLQFLPHTGLTIISPAARPTTIPANFNYLFFLFFSFDPSCCDIVRDATTAGIFSTPHCSLSLLSNTPIQLAATPAFHPTFLLANSPFLFFDLMVDRSFPALHVLASFAPCCPLTTLSSFATFLLVAAHNLPWEGLRYLTVSLLFFAAPFPTTHIEQYCFSGVTCRILFSTSMFATLFSKPPHTLALTYIFSVQHRMLRRRPSRLWCFDGHGIVIVPTALLVQCLRHMPPTMGVACVWCAFSRLRNASRCAVTFCVPKKVANACSPCLTSIHPCTILPSLPGIGSAPFSIVNDGRHINHQKR